MSTNRPKASGPTIADCNPYMCPTFASLSNQVCSNETLMKSPIPRRSKIARLPAPIRIQVNEFLEESLPACEIIEWLTKQGHPGISEDVISRWRNGGLDVSAERLEHREAKRDDARQYASPDQPFDAAGEEIAALHFYDALNRADSSALAESINKSPKNFMELLKTFTHFSRCRLERDRFREYVRQQRKSERQQKGPQNEAVTQPARDIVMKEVLQP